MRALLSTLKDAPVADRFAMGRGRSLGARLDTTDRILAAMGRQCRILCALYGSDAPWRWAAERARNPGLQIEASG